MEWIEGLMMVPFFAEAPLNRSDSGSPKCRLTGPNAHGRPIPSSASLFRHGENVFSTFEYIRESRSRNPLQRFNPISASLRRFAYKEEQVRKKPGREVVTFLLVCNLAMWAINTLETNRADSHPIQVRS